MTCNRGGNFGKGAAVLQNSTVPGLISSDHVSAEYLLLHYSVKVILRTAHSIADNHGELTYARFIEIRP